MCGIVGYIGPQDATPIILHGLKRLEYRGYDSAGIAVVSENKKIDRLRRLGKVRELENVLSRAILKASREIAKGDIVIVQPIHLGHYFESASQSAGLFSPQKMVSLAEDRNFRDAVIEFKKIYIQRALAKHNGNWAAAARTLGMHRSNLHNLAGRLGLRKPSN